MKLLSLFLGKAPFIELYEPFTDVPLMSAPTNDGSMVPFEFDLCRSLRGTTWRAEDYTKEGGMEFLNPETATTLRVSGS